MHSIDQKGYFKTGFNIYIFVFSLLLYLNVISDSSVIF